MQFGSNINDKNTFSGIRQNFPINNEIFYHLNFIIYQLLQLFELSN